MNNNLKWLHIIYNSFTYQLQYTDVQPFNVFLFFVNSLFLYRDMQFCTGMCKLRR